MIKKLYSYLYNKNGKPGLFTYRLIKVFLNLYYPIHLRIVKKYTTEYELKNVVVSLTSFPARIDKLWIVIETLLRQSYKPYKIILWLADSQFESIEKLPKKLRKMIDKGLDIRFCEDIRSHKKYYYTMLEYPNHIVITVDDDTFYPEDLVESLYKTSLKNPNTICCNLAHKITFNDKGVINPYRQWIFEAQGITEASYQLVPIGCEAVLYPPHSLYKDVFDKSKISKLCPLADDLWLKAMASLNGVKAIKTNKFSIPFVNLFTSNKSSLTEENVNLGKNDEQLKNIINEYSILTNIWTND